MASSLGSLVVSLGLDAAQFTAGLSKAEFTAKQASNKIVGAFSGLKGAVAGALAGFTLDEVIKRSVEAERSINRLNTVLSTTGYSAGITADEVERMSQSLKGRTQFDDDDIRKGIASLLRFRDVQGDVFRQAVELAPDIATALDTDIVSAFQKLGKAIADPEKGMRGLKEAGIRLTESQIALAKEMKNTGDIAGAQKLVLDAVTKSVGGAAAGENVGLYGATSAMAKAWDDLLKSFNKSDALGGVAESVISRIADKTKRLADIIGDGKLTQSLVAFFSAGLITPAPELPRDTRTKAINAGGNVTLAEQNAAIGALQRTLEQAQERQAVLDKANAEKRIALARVAAEGTLAIEKDAQQQRLQVLDALNADGLISIRDFFSQRRQIIQDATALEVKAINAQISAQAELSNRAGQEGDYQKQIAAQTAIAKLIDERTRAQQKAGAEQVLNSIREQAELQKVADKLREINAEIAALKGNQAQGTGLKFDLQNETFRNQLSASGDRAGLAQLDELRSLTVARAQFNDKLEEQSQLTARLAIEEERIQNAQRVGAIGEIEALRQTSGARRRAVVELEKTVSALQQVAEASKNPALILQAEQAKAALERLRGETDLLAAKFDTIFTESFSDAFADFIDGSKSASEAFKDFSNSVVREINKLVAQELAKKLFGGIVGEGGIGSVFSGIFGGSSGGSKPSSGGGLFGFLGSLFGGSFASGTPFVPNDMLAFVHRGERIVPATENARGGGREMSFTLVQNFAKGTDKKTVGQAAAAAGESVQRALSRNG